MSDRCMHYFKLRGGTAIDCAATEETVEDGHAGDHWAMGEVVGDVYVEWSDDSEFDGVREEGYHDG